MRTEPDKGEITHGWRGEGRINSFNHCCKQADVGCTGSGEVRSPPKQKGAANLCRHS